MSYWLGIDVGSTFIAAAICRQRPDQPAHLEVVPLGTRADAVRSVIYLSNDGEIVVGEAAERRAGADPGRVVRGFARTADDGIPIVIDGVSYSASALTASVVRWVVDRVAQREGGPARGITVTHPVGWEDGTICAMAQALSAAGLPQVGFCAGVQAAATSYSIRQRIGTGATIAVYDLGGGVFDAAVVRRTGAAAPVVAVAPRMPDVAAAPPVPDVAAAPPVTSILGTPESLSDLGGTDFDDAVFGHVLAAVPALSEWEPGATERLRRGFALCRRECIEAKEALSVDTEVTIPVLLPQLQSEVTLTRTELEDLIRPQITETVEALRRTLVSARIAPADLDVVLLVGGSSRIPLVAQLLEAELGRPVVVDPEADTAIVLGAALCAVPAGALDANGVTMAVDVEPAHPAAAPDGPGSTEFQACAPTKQELAQQAPSHHEPPWLVAAALDVDSPDAEWRRATSERLTRFAAAGTFALVLAAGAVSAPFIMTAHRAADPAPPDVPPKIPAATVAVAPHPPAVQPPAIERPQLPVPGLPVATAAAIPGPNAGSGDARSLANGDAPSVAVTTPAAPTKSLNSTRVKTTAPAPRTGAHRPKPPPPTTRPEAPQVPDWVEQARS
jgi:molecular chaperone DnaK